MTDPIDIGSVSAFHLDVLLDPPGGDLYLWDRPIVPYEHPTPTTVKGIRDSTRRKRLRMEARLWNGRLDRGPSRLVTNPRYLLP